MEVKRVVNRDFPSRRTNFQTVSTWVWTVFRRTGGSTYGEGDSPITDDCLTSFAGQVTNPGNGKMPNDLNSHHSQTER